jgi:hypothetical protein
MVKKKHLLYFFFSFSKIDHTKKVKKKEKNHFSENFHKKYFVSTKKSVSFVQKISPLKKKKKNDST